MDSTNPLDAFQRRRWRLRLVRTGIVLSLARIAGAGLFMLVVSSTPPGIAGWRREWIFVGASTTLALIVIALLLRTFAAQFRRIERSEASLAARNTELEESRVRLERQAADLADVAEESRRANAEAEAARAEAEQARRLAEETTQQLLEAQRVGRLGHWITDEAAGTITWSPQMFEITGLPTQPVMPLDLSRLPPVHPEDAAALFGVRERAIATGETLMAEVRFVRPDGAIRWVHIEMRAQYNAAGLFAHLFGTTQDITERKQAEDELNAAREQLTEARDAAEKKAAALALSEARFRDFALTSSDWFWETDAGHHFTYISEGIRTFGQDPASRIGRNRIEIAAEADRDRDKWDAHIASLHRHEPFRNFVYTGKFGEQPEHTVSISGTPLFDAAGRFLGYRGTGRDITEQIIAEKALRGAKQAAEAANLAKSQFLANMSHELRTPLNAIIGFSEMIELGMKGPVATEYQEYAKLVHQSGDHLLDLINDILDLAKIDAGKFQLREEPSVDQVRIAEACVAMMRENARSREIRLSVEVGERPPLLLADPTRLKQILLNLLSNAIKFTGRGGSVVVAVRRSDEGGVMVDVRDTGIGMTAAEIEVAMEPFGQVEAGYARNHEGTGLGLPLARRLAELHGGSLTLSSEKGHGTTVRVKLPGPDMPHRALALFAAAAG